MSLFLVDIDDSHLEEFTKYLESFDKKDIEYINTGNKVDVQSDLLKFFTLKIAREFDIKKEDILEEFAETFENIANELEEDLNEDEFYEKFERLCLDEEGHLLDYEIEFTDIMAMNNIDIDDDSDELFMSEIRDGVKIVELNFDEDAVASAIFIRKDTLDEFYRYKGFFYEKAIVVDDFSIANIKYIVEKIYMDDKFEELFNVFFFDDDDDDFDIENFGDFLMN